MVKKVLFTGYYGFNNFGDDLFGLACINGLKKTGSNYVPIILSPPVDGVDAVYLVPRFLAALYQGRGFFGKLIRMFFMIYGCLIYSEVVLAGGSVISSGSSFRMRWVQYYLAKFGFCRLSAIGVSVGPFVSDRDRKEARLFINNLNYLCVRDEVSVKECSDLGVDIKVNLYNDLAGCIPLPALDEIKKHSRTLGVSVCRYESLAGGDVGQEQLRNVAIFDGVSDFVIKHNFNVKILVLNSNDYMGDFSLSKKLYDYLYCNGVTAEIVEHVNPVESLSHIAECEVFFSVRLHGAIAAYLLSVPFVLVEYHEKCRDFLDYIGFNSENRISADVFEKINIVESIEGVCRGSGVCSIGPEDYINRASKIFSESPWAN